MLRGIELLSSEQRENLLKRTVDTTLRSSRVQGGFANWPAVFEGSDSKLLVQWCHGAPGVIIALGSFPKDESIEIEELLIKAGHLVWEAGPLKKGIGLCHGTDGNGYALLKLYQRTGEQMWLERARSFAMVAAEQRNQRHTLWTGDIGLGCYLSSCIDGDDSLPGLDYV